MVIITYILCIYRRIVYVHTHTHTAQSHAFYTEIGCKLGTHTLIPRVRDREKVNESMGATRVPRISGKACDLGIAYSMNMDICYLCIYLYTFLIIRSRPAPHHSRFHMEHSQTQAITHQFHACGMHRYSVFIPYYMRLCAPIA